MPLGGRITVDTVAWRYDGNTRVFRIPEVRYWGREEDFRYETLDGQYGINNKGVWLYFEVSSSYFLEQISGIQTDRIGILNALFSTSVLFYPDYSGQPGISYTVKTDNNRVDLLRTNRGLFRPEQIIKMRVADRQPSYPSFLNYR